MQEIVLLLLEWYQFNKRILPWRETKNPYYVWISEIMLQQTRIETVIPYYERFIKKIPDISSLAVISLDDLLKLWEGLGYYSRARNLKKAAQIIMEKYYGEFPSTYKEIIMLPGIGEYTASAIASICFNASTPTVDGNVLRVYTRVMNDRRNIDLVKTKKEIREELSKIMPSDAGNFNEALMELGEVICLPNGMPKCDICPIKKLCRAYIEKTWQQIPVRLEKKRKNEKFFTVFLFSYQEYYAISKRKEQQLLQHLWEFFNIDGILTIDEVKKYLEEKHIPFISIEKSIENKHIFTHQIWYMQAYIVKVSSKMDHLVWKTLNEIDMKYAIPTAFQPFLEVLKKRDNA